MSIITAPALIVALAKHGHVGVIDGDRVVVWDGHELAVVVMDDDRREVDGVLAFDTLTTGVLITCGDGTEAQFEAQQAIDDVVELHLDIDLTIDGDVAEQLVLAIDESLADCRPPVCDGCGTHEVTDEWGVHWNTPTGTGSVAESCSDACAAIVEARRGADGVLLPLDRAAR